MKHAVKNFISLLVIACFLTDAAAGFGAGFGAVDPQAGSPAVFQQQALLARSTAALFRPNALKPLTFFALVASLRAVLPQDAAPPVMAASTGLAYIYARYALGRALQLSTQLPITQRLSTLAPLIAKIADPEQKKTFMDLAESTLDAEVVPYSDGEALADLAEEHLDTDPQRAERLLRVELRLNSSSPASYKRVLRLGDLMYRLHDKSLLQDIREGGKKFPEIFSPRGLMALAHAAALHGFKEDAEFWRTLAFAQDSETHRRWLRAQWALLHVHLGRPQEARNLLNRLSEELQSESRSGTLSTLSIIAEGFYALGDSEKASYWLNQAARLFARQVDNINRLPSSEEFDSLTQALRTLIALPTTAATLEELLLLAKSYEGHSYLFFARMNEWFELISAVPEAPAQRQLIRILAQAPGSLSHSENIRNLLTHLKSTLDPAEDQPLDQLGKFSAIYRFDILEPDRTHPHFLRRAIEHLNNVLQRLSPGRLVDHDEKAAFRELLTQPHSERNSRDITHAVLGRMLSRYPRFANPTLAWTRTIDALEHLASSTALDQDALFELEVELKNALAWVGDPLHDQVIAARFSESWSTIAQRTFPTTEPNKVLTRLTVKDQLAHLILAFEWRRRGLPTDMLDTLLGAHPKGLNTIRPLLGLFRTPQALDLKRAIRSWTQYAHKRPVAERAKFFEAALMTLREVALLADPLERYSQPGRLQEILRDPVGMDEKPRQIRNLVMAKLDEILETSFSGEQTNAGPMTQMTPQFFRAIFKYQAKHRGDLLRQVLAAYVTEWMRTQNRQSAAEAAYAVLKTIPGNEPFQDPLWLNGIGARRYAVYTHTRQKEAQARYVAGQWEEALIATRRLVDLSPVAKDLHKVLRELSDRPFTLQNARVLEKALKTIHRPATAKEEIVKREALNHLHNARSNQNLIQTSRQQTVELDVLYDPLDVLDMRYPNLGGSCLDCEVGASNAATQHFVTHLGYRTIAAFTVATDPNTGEVKRTQTASITVARNKEGDFVPVSRIYTSSTLVFDEAFADYMKAWATQMKVQAALPYRLKTAGGGLEFSGEVVRRFGRDVTKFSITLPKGPEDVTEMYTDAFGNQELPQTIHFGASAVHDGRQAQRLTPSLTPRPLTLLWVIGVALGAWALNALALEAGPTLSASLGLHLLFGVHAEELKKIDYELRNVSREIEKMQNKVGHLRRSMNSHYGLDNAALQEYAVQFQTLHNAMEAAKRRRSELKQKRKDLVNRPYVPYSAPMTAPPEEDPVIQTLRRASLDTLKAYLNAAWKGRNRPHEPKAKRLHELMQAPPPIPVARLHQIPGVNSVRASALIEYIRREVLKNEITMLLLPFLLPLAAIAWGESAVTASTALAAPTWLRRAA